MRRVFIIISLFCLYFSSCKNEKKETLDTQTTSQLSKDPYISSVQTLLQGTWKNLDEKGVTLTFDGNTRIENIQGKPEGKVRYFEIAEECKNDAKPKGELRTVKSKAKYISLQDIDLCYYIVKLDQVHMHLKTIGRGNLVRYKRMGATKGVNIINTSKTIKPKKLKNK